MMFKRKAITVIAMLAFVALMLWCFHQFPAIVALYSSFVFTPYQWLRGLLFGFLPFSLGDILYCAATLWAVITMAKWLKFIVYFRRDRLLLAGSLLKTATTLLYLYLLFFLGWGGNYAKAPLAQAWGMVTVASGGQRYV